jgi:hypothetical protein
VPRALLRARDRCRGRGCDGETGAVGADTGARPVPQALIRARDRCRRRGCGRKTGAPGSDAGARCRGRSARGEFRCALSLPLLPLWPSSRPRCALSLSRRSIRARQRILAASSARRCRDGSPRLVRAQRAGGTYRCGASTRRGAWRTSRARPPLAAALALRFVVAAPEDSGAAVNLRRAARAPVRGSRRRHPPCPFRPRRQPAAQIRARRKHAVQNAPARQTPRCTERRARVHTPPRRAAVPRPRAHAAPAVLPARHPRRAGPQAAGTAGRRRLAATPTRQIAPPMMAVGAGISPKMSRPNATARAGTT